MGWESEAADLAEEEASLEVHAAQTSAACSACLCARLA